MQLGSFSLRRSGQGPLSSRSGTIAVAAAAAAAAAILVVVAVHAARKSATTSAAPTPVLVANQLIAKGSTAEAIASAHSFRVVELRDSSVRAGAITDVSQLDGKVAQADIYPGQQIVAGAFAPASGVIAGRLGGSDRAVAVPLDAAHGLLGTLRDGDHVDVLAGFSTTNSGSNSVMRVLARDVVVLKAPSSSNVTGSDKNIVLRVSDQTATQLAFAADNGKLWVVLRPGAGARDDAGSDKVTLGSILSASAPKAGSGR